MSSASTNPMDQAVVRFLVKKLHKWRGTYQRIFVLTKTHVVNVDPNNWNVTNSWAYTPDIVAFSPSVSNDTEFTLTVKVRPAAGSLAAL